MSEKKFSKKHEWVSIEGDIATVGITKHATELLGDIVFVEIPEAGKTVDKDGQTAVVESTKAASDVYSPISGEVLEGNKSIVDDPVSVNTDPEGASWFFKLKVRDKSELDSLMSQSDYEKFVAENPS
jgi:glycine cleavage system H protein